MRYIFIHIFCVIFNIAYAQALNPSIKGNLLISISDGKFSAEIEYNSLSLSPSHKIFLNKGLVIKEAYINEKLISMIKDTTDYLYEAWLYHIPDTCIMDEKSTLSIKYEGTFEVIKNEDASKDYGDWKGNMAFNGYSFRATEQSVWYPIIYDSKGNISYDEITYTFNIDCRECDIIYLSGNAPIKSSSGLIQSNVALPLLIYATKGSFSQADDTYFINSKLTNEEQDIIVQWLDSIQSFLVKNTGLPYGKDNITFISTAPVTKKSAWMFFTYPTVAIISPEQYNLKSYFNHKHQLKDDRLISFLSHELGHYYFGKMYSPKGTMRWAILEGITEYMALQCTRSLLGETKYEEKLMSYIKESIDLEVKSLNEMNESDFTETYRYNYFPLLLTTLEKKVGSEKIWQWINFILQKKLESNIDYALFKKTIIDSGVSEIEFKNVEMVCFNASNSKDNVIKIIERGFKH